MSIGCPLCGARILDDGRVRLDHGGGLVVANGRVAHLTRQEFALFATLWEGRPRTFTKEQLLAATADFGLDDREIKIVDVFVCKARKKLDPLGVRIETAWGKGYRIIGDGADPDQMAAASAGGSTLQEVA